MSIKISRSILCFCLSCTLLSCGKSEQRSLYEMQGVKVFVPSYIKVNLKSTEEGFKVKSSVISSVEMEDGSAFSLSVMVYPNGVVLDKDLEFMNFDCPAGEFLKSGKDVLFGENSSFIICDLGEKEKIGKTSILAKENRLLVFSVYSDKKVIENYEKKIGVVWKNE